MTYNLDIRSAIRENKGVSIFDKNTGQNRYTGMMLEKMSKMLLVYGDILKINTFVFQREIVQNHYQFPAAICEIYAQIHILDKF